MTGEISHHHKICT